MADHSAVFEKLREQRNRDNIFANKNGVFITFIQKGAASAELTVTENVKNPIGTVHGGAVFTLCDSCGGAASASYGYGITTVDANIHYLRPTMNTTKLMAEAKVVKAGKRIIVAEIHAVDQDGAEVAFGVFTYMRLKQKYEGIEDIIEN